MTTNEGQVARNRLVRQVSDRVRAYHPDTPSRDVELIVQQCCSDLDVTSLDSLPELVERLALQRLADQPASMSATESNDTEKGLPSR